MDASIQLSAEDNAYYDNLINEVFAGHKDTDIVDSKSIEIFTKKLTQGLEKGFDKPLAKVDYSTPDDGTIKQMEKNIYEFSGAKSYKQLKELNEALRDGNRLKTYEEFKKDAQVILEGNTRHLKVEWQNAINSAIAARKWLSFPAGALLQFQTVGDDRVRPSHAELDGIVQRKESPFWLIYYPPLDWGCRCVVIEVYDKPETDLSTIALPDVPLIFQPNVGISGTIFSKDSAMFIGCPQGILEQAVYKMPLDHQFEVVQKGLRLHYIAKQQAQQDLEVNLKIAKELVISKNKKVDLLPVVYNNPSATALLFEGGKNNKYPDLRMDGVLVELEGAYTFENSKTQSIMNSIQRGLKQADTCLTHVHFHVKDSVIKSCIKRIEAMPHNEGKKVIVRNANGKYFGLE